MAGWNNTPFLQALGWAVVNNIWQMAALWLCFLLVQQAAPLSSLKKYRLLVSGIFLGFGWFLVSFFSYLAHPVPQPFFDSFSFSTATPLFPLVLSSASVAYLVLLFFPAARLFINWLFIKKIRAHQLQKGGWQHRLFVEQTRLQLGIKKQVPVFCSKLVSSPVTIGFLKPIILLPFSIFTHLSAQQAEAILLHELAHIRRSDYFINLLLSFIHVFLYFNPFVLLFIKRIEQEREACCDETVLQFGYDKISYASALLELERRSAKVELAMAASNKNYLLRRIETIVGIKQKSGLKPAQLLPVFAGLLFLFVINSYRYQAIKTDAVALENAAPLQSFAQHMFETGAEKGIKKGQQEVKNSVARLAQTNLKSKTTVTTVVTEVSEQIASEPPVFNSPKASPFKNVSFDEADANLTEAQKEVVKETIETTKKVLALQWKEVDKSIADAMTSSEKQQAKNDYLNKVAEANWQKLENTLKRGYEEIDWNSVTASLNEMVASAEIDSVEAVYAKALAQIEKIHATANAEQLVLPDASEQQVLALKSKLKAALSQIKTLRTRKVIRL